MGCDIHFAVEKLVNGIWVAADTYKEEADGDGTSYSYIEYDESFYTGRNYRLFSILADVRNGRGFAGCDTGDRLTPISKPKGTPDNASPEVAEFMDSYGIDGHSHSYLTLQEIIDYDWTQTATLRGVVSAREYLEFKLMGTPDSWSGGVSGGNVEHISNEEMDAYIKECEKAAEATGWGLVHKMKEKTQFQSFLDKDKAYFTQIEWQRPYYSLVQEFLTKTFWKMMALGKPEEVRCVFFFDN